MTMILLLSLSAYLAVSLLRIDGDGTPVVPSSPAPSSAPPPVSAAPSVSSAPPSPVSTPPVAPSGDASGLGGTPSPQSVRQLMSQGLGYDFTKYADDASAMDAIRSVMHLAQRWRQESQQWQQVVPHWTQFQQWQQQNQGQQPQQQAPVTQTKDWWGAPEYDPRWQQAIEPDGQGGHRVKPGFSPDILHKLTNHQNWMREKAQSLFQNPIETLKPGIEQLVQPLIQQAIESSFQQQSGLQAGHQILARNAGWLWNPQPNPITGQREMSETGKMYNHYVQQLAARGIKDPQTADEIAQAMIKTTLYERMYQAQQQGLPVQVQPQQPVAANGTPGPVNRIAQFASNGVQNTDRTQQLNGPTSLLDLMRADFAAAGLNDQMLAAQMANPAAGGVR